MPLDLLSVSRVVGLVRTTMVRSWLQQDRHWSLTHPRKNVETHPDSGRKVLCLLVSHAHWWWLSRLYWVGQPPLECPMSDWVPRHLEPVERLRSLEQLLETRAALMDSGLVPNQHIDDS